MQVTHHTWYSPHLSKDMGLNHYGQQGQPVLAFPAQEGNHRNFEDFGMIAALRPLIESGAIQLFTVDSVDGESWTAKTSTPVNAACAMRPMYAISWTRSCPLFATTRTSPSGLQG